MIAKRTVEAMSRNIPPPPFAENKSRLADVIAMLCKLASEGDDFLVQGLLLKQAGALVEELRERLLPFAEWQPPLDPPFGPNPVERTT